MTVRPAPTKESRRGSRPSTLQMRHARANLQLAQDAVWVHAWCGGVVVLEVSASRVGTRVLALPPALALLELALPLADAAIVVVDVVVLVVPALVVTASVAVATAVAAFVAAVFIAVVSVLVVAMVIVVVVAVVVAGFLHRTDATTASSLPQPTARRVLPNHTLQASRRP